ncbi:MAG: dihydrofolate reductase FolA [Parcubacteria group bacterium Greene0714_21]|nr:MAG: dihydrofolate reductase FolA [Parcubacteria group bacterium Greene0416_39]TSC98559.1 MAG: dihydrofolate reductase FolA [Parcubacteria group bacterium Greene1014_47]TSD04320.1 MAG: dihydrofolate reductase FolA [Parcubacteria group bacterium Greene0714_21]
MKAFIIAALTADGFIAKSSQHLTDWTSKEDKHFFVEKTKQAGVVVFGQNTFETIRKPLKDRLTIVYSKDKQYEGVEVTQKDPRELLEDLEKRGYKEVAICGGATIYTMFMQAGVVDKLYLSVEPVFFGQGLTLFTKELDKKLELVSVQKLGDHTVLLEYIVTN